MRCAPLGVSKPRGYLRNDRGSGVKHANIYARAYPIRRTRVAAFPPNNARLDVYRVNPRLGEYAAGRCGSDRGLSKKCTHGASPFFRHAAATPRVPCRFFYRTQHSHLVYTV